MFKRQICIVAAIGLLMTCTPRKTTPNGPKPKPITKQTIQQKPKLLLSGGSEFVPTKSLTTCNIGNFVVKIFKPSNQTLAPNRYYYAPLFDLVYLRNGKPRPPEEIILKSKNLNLNDACKKSICKALEKDKNCKIVLSPLPISFIEVAPQQEHALNAFYKRNWRKRFKAEQQISGQYRVILPRHNKKDYNNHCPLPFQIRYHHRAFKGKVAPQLVIDLTSISNSSQYNRLLQKVQVGTGSKPTLVTPYQVHELITKQTAHITKYTINLYGHEAEVSPFVKSIQNTLTQGMENILDANNKVNITTLKRLSKELVSISDLQKFRDTVNKTVNSFNSARTATEQRRVFSRSESWNLFSVFAKGALAYFGLPDQPTKWTDEEWRKFIQNTKVIFNWKQSGQKTKTWRIRAINLMQLSKQNQIRNASMRTAKFRLGGLTYVETTHMVDLQCKAVPLDNHCDKQAGEKPGKGKNCDSDCGCCWKKKRRIRRNHIYHHTVKTEDRKGKGCVVKSGKHCFSKNHTIYKRHDSIKYRCIGRSKDCRESKNPNGKHLFKYVVIHGPNDNCFTWRRRWCGRSVIDEYKVKHSTYFIKKERICKLKN